jgi:hypothetical protein
MAKRLNRIAEKIASKAEAQSWIARELAGCEFEDERLGKRFEKVFKHLSNGIGRSIPWACQDWSNTKAAYRFFANERVSEAAILAGYFHATEKRMAVAIVAHPDAP